ncbi:MAG: FecR family protein, partial [Sulfurospirillaceae bacterium]|nr:FecR family protein [Sulfurospirillaceae bacterium]
MKLLMKVLVLLIFFTHSALFASAGKVSLLNGEAYAQRDSQKIALQNGSILEEKDVIITAKGAQVQLIFEDKTVITLGSESEFKIEEYFNDAKAPKAKFKFGQGTFKTITGQIGKTAPENFTLETKTATIGIRGTIVGGIIPPPSSPAPETIFCLSGTIFAASLLNPQAPPVTIPAGSLTFSSPEAPPSPPRPATQQELQQINQSTGTPPPPPVAGSNAPPTAGGSSGSDGSGSTTPTPSSPTVTPQTFVPTAAINASQTNLQTNSQTQIQTQIQTQTCPAGTTGTYPNCGTCTALQSGTYPNCVDLTCPAGQSGTYPNCGTCTALQSGTYPNCVDLTCPAGQSGTYPNCGTCTAL